MQVLYAFAVDRLLKAILSCLSRSVLGGNAVQKDVMPTPSIPHVKIDGIGLPKNRGFLSNQPILPYPTNTPILWKQKQTFTLNLSNLKSTFISLGVKSPKTPGNKQKIQQIRDPTGSDVSQNSSQESWSWCVGHDLPRNASHRRFDFHDPKCKGWTIEASDEPNEEMVPQ